MSIEDPEKLQDAKNMPSSTIIAEDERAIIMELDNQLQMTLQQQTSEPSAEPSVTKTIVPKVILCAVCNEKASKYKCSRCYLP